MHNLETTQHQGVWMSAQSVDKPTDKESQGQWRATSQN